MARPQRVLTDDEVIQVEALAAALSVEQIADFLCMSKVTFYEILERQPGVSERLKKGKARAIGDVARGLIQQARDGNMAAAMFYLKTQAGWREKQDINHVSEDGTMSPSRVEIVAPYDNSTD